MYYQQLEEKVLPKMNNFQEDLTVHDRKSLQGYEGIFLHGSRTTGTFIVKLDEWLMDHLFKVSEDQNFRPNFEWIWEKFQKSYLILITSSTVGNKWFHIGENGVVKRSNRKRIEEYAREKLYKQYTRYRAKQDRQPDFKTMDDILNDPELYLIQ